MATNKVQTGIRFEPELLYKITHVAKENKRSLNAQLEFLAQNCVRQFEAENGKIPVNDEVLYKKKRGAFYASRFLFGLQTERARCETRPFAVITE